MGKAFRLRGLTAALAVAAATTGVVVGTAAPALATTCHWVVTWPTAGVYEAANTHSTVVKTKQNGDVVGPYCDQVNDPWGTGPMVAVACTCAPNHGTGWMRKDALRYLGA